MAHLSYMAQSNSKSYFMLWISLTWRSQIQNQISGDGAVFHGAVKFKFQFQVMAQSSTAQLNAKSNFR
jgi:hypothetical protein